MLTLYSLFAVMALSSLGTWFAWDPRPRLSTAKSIILAFIGYFAFGLIFSLDPRLDGVLTSLEKSSGIHGLPMLLILYATAFFAPFCITRIGGHLLMWLVITLVFVTGDDEDEVEKY